MFEGVQVKVITLLIHFFCWWFSKVCLDGERLSEFASMRTGRDPREDCSDSKLPTVNNWLKSSSDIPTKTLNIARAKYGQMVSRDELSNVYTLDLVSYLPSLAPRGCGEVFVSSCSLLGPGGLDS